MGDCVIRGLVVQVFLRGFLRERGVCRCRIANFLSLIVCRANHASTLSERSAILCCCVLTGSMRINWRWLLMTRHKALTPSFEVSTYLIRPRARFGCNGAWVW